MVRYAETSSEGSRSVHIRRLTRSRSLRQEVLLRFGADYDKRPSLGSHRCVFCTMLSRSMITGAGVHAREHTGFWITRKKSHRHAIVRRCTLVGAFAKRPYYWSHRCVFCTMLSRWMITGARSHPGNMLGFG